MIESIALEQRNGKLMVISIPVLGCLPCFNCVVCFFVSVYLFVTSLVVEYILQSVETEVEN